MKIGNTILKTIGSGKYMVIRRGDIFYADLRPVVGSQKIIFPNKQNTPVKIGNTILKTIGSGKYMVIRRGDIFYADLRPVVGSEQGGVRPVLIIQNDVGNRHSPTVICAAITSQMNKAKLPTHVELDSRRYALVKDSVVLLEQLRTIDKTRLKDKVCHLDAQILVKIDKALEISLELYT